MLHISWVLISNQYNTTYVIQYIFNTKTVKVQRRMCVLYTVYEYVHYTVPLKIYSLYVRKLNANLRNTHSVERRCDTSFQKSNSESEATDDSNGTESSPSPATRSKLNLSRKRIYICRTTMPRREK